MCARSLCVHSCAESCCVLSIKMKEKSVKLFVGSPVVLKMHRSGIRLVLFTFVKNCYFTRGKLPNKMTGIEITEIVMIVFQ